ncbi:MAG: hypothetical protein DSY55_03850 [Clostridia bacterium]|nr:MAG: hypothetical protein DSY55_03850 [Clostridia bacterium]
MGDAWIRFAADDADFADSHGFFLILSAFIRLICVICGESALRAVASLFLCGLAALREINLRSRNGCLTLAHT